MNRYTNNEFKTEIVIDLEVSILIEFQMVMFLFYKLLKYLLYINVIHDELIIEPMFPNFPVFSVIYS